MPFESPANNCLDYNHISVCIEVEYFSSVDWSKMKKAIFSLPGE